MKKKKALSTIETALIAVIVCVVAIGGFTAFNKIKTELAKMSRAETTGTLALNPGNAGGSGDGGETGEDPTNNISIDKCEKTAILSKICKVYGCPGDEGTCVRISETVGTLGERWIYIPLSENTAMTGKSPADCAAKMVAGSICYSQTGEVVQCDDNGEFDVTKKGHPPVHFQQAYELETLR